MSDPIDIVARLSGMAADHGPDGWPAVQMRDITALCNEVTRLRRWNSTHAPRLAALEALHKTAQAEAEAGRDAVATLASERAANAILTDEVDRLRAELAEAQQLARDQFDLRAEQRDERDRLRAALAQAGAPEGWQLVPVEPTPWMLQALFGYWMDCINNPKQRNVAKAEYKAMLTAAEALPHHPSPAQREPLSDDAALDIAECMRPVLKFAGDWRLALNYCRAIERAHGITTSGTKGAAS